MRDNPPSQDDFRGHQTRRQFIQSVLIKSAYAAPLIATFSVSNAGAASSFSFMISSKKSPSPMMSPMGMMMMGSGGSGGMMTRGMGMLWS